MKWLVSLAIMGVLTLLLLDLGLFERERFGIASHISQIPGIDHDLPFVGSLHTKALSPTGRIVLSTITIIMGLYLVVRLFLRALPPRWFTLDSGQVGRLPDPRLLRDRVREQEDNRKIKKLLHVPNGRWMAPLGLITLFFLLVALPIVTMDRTYDWAWGLSILVPISLFGCWARPDRARKLVLTTPELQRLLTPRYFRDYRRRGRVRRRWDRLRARDRLAGMRMRAQWQRFVHALLRRSAPPPTGLYPRVRTAANAVPGTAPTAPAFTGNDPLAGENRIASTREAPPRTPSDATSVPGASVSAPTTSDSLLMRLVHSIRGRGR